MLVRNHDRSRVLDTRLLRRIVYAFLQETLAQPRFELSIHVVGESEIIRLNETFLRHAGPTDVIAFDYCEVPGGGAIEGELFVCLPVAVAQARRYRTTWQTELVRYVIHGVLHLCGHDDAGREARRRMKKVEDGALKGLSSRFRFGDIGLRRRRAGLRAVGLVASK